MISADSRITIIGAGVFGLSTALWLAKSGYKNIRVFDRCPLGELNYDPFKGCDGASADINKIYRATYGANRKYQALALEARDMFEQWDEAIRTSKASDLPNGVTPDDRLLDLCGLFYLGEGNEMHPFYADSLKSTSLEAPDMRKLQYIKNDPADEARLLEASGPEWVKKLHILDRINDGDTSGFLDVGAGINIADKACTYARFLCERAGVKFIFGCDHGNVERLLVEGEGEKKCVVGIKTRDGSKHLSDLVVVACGPWSASIIPEASQTIQATAGTVMFIDIPKERKDLLEKFHPDNFPAWTYRKSDGDSYYQGGGFPITKQGRLKFGYLGRKYTNFQEHPIDKNLRVSIPRTKYTEAPIESVPLFGLTRMKQIIGQAFPELKEFGFTDNKLCWYTDTIDDDYCVIDYVPGYCDSLFLCTGHGFKFLPNLGKYVKNQLERNPDQFTESWKWRAIDGDPEYDFPSKTHPSLRSLSQYSLAGTRDFQFE